MSQDLKAKKVKIPDEGGDTVTCFEFDGHLFPGMPDTRGVEGLKSVNIRDDDVLLCTYPKSGTHWVFEITRELLSGEVIQDEITMSSTFMEMTAEENYANLPSPRVLTTHVLLEQLPADILKKKIKIIQVLRNPKDATVSFYNFVRKLQFLDYQGEWKNFMRSFTLGKFCYGSWFDYVNSWVNVQREHPDCPIIFLCYEDLKKDQMGEMRKLCKFLGLERSDEFLSRVVENTSFDNMKTQKQVKAGVVFRKGQTGDWKNWFTVEQKEWFDQLYQERMKDCPLNLPYSESSS